MLACVSVWVMLDTLVLALTTQHPRSLRNNVEETLARTSRFAAYVPYTRETEAGPGGEVGKGVAKLRGEIVKGIFKFFGTIMGSYTQQGNRSR